MQQKSLYNHIGKRLLDVCLVLALSPVFFPISLITALLIRMTSRGPVFADVPERIGKNQKPFKMYKFRSMIVNAHQMLRKDKKYQRLYEEYKNSSYKLKNDPRITTIGRYIRRHSIDEIPQFINVLKGDMSLVGPRAYYSDELVEQTKKYPHTKAEVSKVLSVRPGITGLWQVSGRSDVNFDKRVAIDAKYVDNMSLIQDLKIILKTPWAMVSGKGAV